MQNQSDYTRSVENTNYFPTKGPELTQNRALTMEGDERLKKEKKTKQKNPNQKTPILWNDLNFITHIQEQKKVVVSCIKLVKEAG